MIHEIYPQYFKHDFGRTIRNKRKLIKRATMVIAISENTKKDILGFYNIPEEKIKVIYHGNSFKPIDSKPDSMSDIPNKYMLYVGSRFGYKNFMFFVKSISSLFEKYKDLKLVVAGGYSGKDSFKDEEIKVFEELNIKDKIIYFPVNDSELAWLYQNAICFCFPTLYEGFGLPPLEAFACGCPVVMSDTSSLPEVGGDAALYFNPNDSKDILRSISLIVDDEDLRLNLIEKGKEQLKKFSLEKTSIETIKLYNEISNKYGK